MSDADRASGHKFHADARTAWQQQNLRWETENAFMNHQSLYEMRREGQVKCLSDVKESGPCIIVGSGSTLDGVMERLKDWKGAIVSSTTHGSTLVRYGAPPRYMTCLDPRTAPDPEMDVPHGGWDKTRFLTHVSAPKAYFDKWFAQTKMPAYVFRILEPTVPWYTKHLPWAYPWAKVGLLPFIDSVSSEVSLAARLGFDPIFCIGVDYGGPRFKQSLWKNGQWETGSTSGYIPKEYKDSLGRVRDDIPFEAGVMGDGGIITDRSMVYAKRGLLIAAYMRINHPRTPLRLYQMSTPSNVIELPFMTFDDVLACQGENLGTWSEEKKARVSENIEITLAKTDTFMIPVDGGFGTDYRVYMMRQENIVEALSNLNMEILTNKADLIGKEKMVGLPIAEQIEKGIIVVEHGELVIHEREDLKHFSVQNMKGVDIEKTADHIRYVYEESKK